MKEDVIIIHGYKAHGNSVWIPWLTQELEKRGHKVWHPNMPNPDEPHLKEWLKEFEKTVSKTKNPLIIIGHSLGGSLVLRLLENEYEWSSRLLKAYTLGAPTYLRTKAPDFFIPALDWSKIRKHSGELVAIWSKDDDRVPESHIREIQKETDAQVEILDGYGHFLFDEFPYLLKIILESQL